MLHSVSNGRGTVADQAAQLSTRGSGDDGINLLRLTAFEYASAFKDKAASLAANFPGDALESEEHGGAVAAVHHEVIEMSLTHDISRVGLGNAGLGELRQVGALAVRFFVPARDR